MDGGQRHEADGAGAVSGGDKTVTAVHVRLGRQSGTGNVTLRLENDAGSVIESISVLGTHIAYGTAGVRGELMDWVGDALRPSEERVAATAV